MTDRYDKMAREWLSRQSHATFGGYYVDEQDIARLLERVAYKQRERDAKIAESIPINLDMPRDDYTLADYWAGKERARKDTAAAIREQETK